MTYPKGTSPLFVELKCYKKRDGSKAQYALVLVYYIEKISDIDSLGIKISTKSGCANDVDAHYV